MNLKHNCRYIGKWLFVFFVQTPWILLRTGMTFSNIIPFILAVIFVVGISFWVGLRDLISAVLLLGFTEETLRIVWIAVSSYIIAKRTKDNVESDNYMQLCNGLVLSQTPRFLASILAVGIGFWVHIRLGWGFWGTISSVIFIEVLFEKLFDFALLILVGTIETSKNDK